MLAQPFLADKCEDARVSDPPAPAATATRPSRRLFRLAGWVVSLAVVALAAAVLRDRWESLGGLEGLPGLAPSAAAAALLLVANAVLAGTWREVVALAGPRLRPTAAAWVWAVSQLARYTVGAAQVGGRAVAGRRYGLSAAAGAVTTLVEVGWQMSLTALLALVTLPWWLPVSNDLTWLAAVGVLPAAVLLVGLVTPRWLLASVARVLSAPGLSRLVGERLLDVARTVRVSRGQGARITALFAVNTALRVAAFLVVFVAVGGELGHTAHAVGAYAAGQLVGRVAVFAPGGIGPQEGVTALVLAPVLGGGAAVVVVAATRVLELLAELAFLGLARLARPAATP